MASKKACHWAAAMHTYIVSLEALMPMPGCQLHLGSFVWQRNHRMGDAVQCHSFFSIVCVLVTAQKHLERQAGKFHLLTAQMHERGRVGGRGR